MLFGNKNTVDADSFWRDRETQLGTPVRARILGRIIDESSTVPRWGLFYTTESAIYFQTFASESWMSMLFTGSKTGRTKDETIEIPSDSLKVFRVVSRKGGFFRLFGKPPIVEIIWSGLNGEEESLTFETDADADAFVSSLPRG